MAKTAPNQLDTAERAHLASVVFDLAVQGYTQRQIDAITAAPDGPTGGRRISKSRVGELIREHAAASVNPKVEEWRALQVGRLEEILSDHRALRDANWADAMNGKEKPAVAVDRALNGMTRVIDQESKLQGLYVTRVEGTVTEVTQQDIALQEMVAELKAKNSAVEDQLRAGREHPQ